MRPVGILVDPPVLNDLASLVEVGEQVLVLALVAQVAVEVFNKTDLYRLAGRDLLPFDPERLLPGQDRIRSELGAVVTDDHARATSGFDDLAKLTNNAQRCE